MSPNDAWMDVNDRRFEAIVEANTHIGYGRMMQIIETIWRRKDPDGALTVGECVITKKLKAERCRKEGHDKRVGNSYDWCDRCGERLDVDG